MINLYTILLIGVTLAVILSRRTMYAILLLILLFTLVAVFVYSLGVDFIGLIFVIVYVGAIATLFLFIVMMLGGEDWETRAPLDLNTNNLLNASGYISNRWASFINKANWYAKHIVLDLLIVFGFGLSLIGLVSDSFAGHFPAWLDVAQSTYNSNMFNTSFLYGVFFYDYWYLPFLLAGVVLFIAMLGSIVLTTRLFVCTSFAAAKAPNISSDATDKDKKSAVKPADKDADSLLANLVAKQQLDHELPVSWWLPQLLLTGLCFVVGWVFKDFFIVSDLSRWLYIGGISMIYLVVSHRFYEYQVAKRVAKLSRKS